MVHSEAYFKFQIKFENQKKKSRYWLVKWTKYSQQGNMWSIYVVTATTPERTLVTVTFPLPTVRKNCFKKLAILSLASALPVLVMDQKRGQVITHGETNLSFLLAKSTWVVSRVVWVAPKIDTPSKHHLKVRKFLVDTPMNFLLIPIESVTMGVLISLPVPQHAFSFLLK